MAKDAILMVGYVIVISMVLTCIIKSTIAYYKEKAKKEIEGIKISEINFAILMDKVTSALYKAVQGTLLFALALLIFWYAIEFLVYGKTNPSVIDTAVYLGILIYVTARNLECSFRGVMLEFFKESKKEGILFYEN